MLARIFVDLFRQTNTHNNAAWYINQLGFPLFLQYYLLHILKCVCIWRSYLVKLV
jgi:hypothetical protein